MCALFDFDYFKNYTHTKERLSLAPNVLSRVSLHNLSLSPAGMPSPTIFLKNVYVRIDVIAMSLFALCSLSQPCVIASVWIDRAINWWASILSQGKSIILSAVFSNSSKLDIDSQIASLPTVSVLEGTMWHERPTAYSLGFDVSTSQVFWPLAHLQNTLVD